MYNEANTTSLATTMTAGFMLPTSLGGGFSSEELAEDTAGMQLNFPRVKMPSGGGLAFEVPSAMSTKPEITQTLQGIILFHHPTNNYWPGGNEDENAPPSCSSMNGVTGHGNPGGPCKDCSCNQWGTGKMGFGKACKNGFSLYLLRNGEALPLHFSLPPTSIKSFTDFVTTFISRQRGVCGSLVEIGLEKTNSKNNGKDYSVATFTLLQDFLDDELDQILAYARGMRAQIKAMNDLKATSVVERQYSEPPAYPSGDYVPYQTSAPVHSAAQPAYSDYPGFQELADDGELPY